jgi:hypothetical protein
MDLAYSKTKCSCGRYHNWKYAKRVWTGKYLVMEFAPKKLWKRPVPLRLRKPDAGYLVDSKLLELNERRIRDGNLGYDNSD